MSVKYNIFYLDDEKANTYFFRKRFLAQYEVTVFQKTEDFFGSLREFTPDLIVLDLMMPQMTGFDVLNILRATERFRFIPVMVLTAMDKSQSLTNCFELGADDFMVKPADFTELSVRMESLIHRFYKGRDYIQKRRIDSMKRMISGFNHEFNNHLTILQSGIEMLGMSLREEKSQNRIEMLKGTIRRSADLLKVLTSLYVPRNDNEERPELREMFQALGDMIQQEFGNKGFSIKTSFCEVPLGMYAAIGTSGMGQILSALLQNCLDSFLGTYGRTPQVTITSEYLEDSVKITINDNGSGIPQTHLPKIFDLFFTTKGSLGGQIVGNKRTERGLGLCIVEGLLRDCGGRIQVESVEGAGTTVTLHIPVGRSSALFLEGEISIAEEGRSYNEPLDIVLLHDQPMDSLALIRFLELQGQEIKVVNKVENLKEHNHCNVLILNHSNMEQNRSAVQYMREELLNPCEAVLLLPPKNGSQPETDIPKDCKIMQKPLNFSALSQFLNRIRYSPIFSRY